MLCKPRQDPIKKRHHSVAAKAKASSFTVPQKQHPVPSRPRSRELMVNLASATGWEARVSPRHSWRITTQAGRSRPACSAGSRPQLLHIGSAELRGEGCVWPASTAPARSGAALAPKRQAAHHRDHGGSASSASGTSPTAPFVGRGEKWRATSTGQRGEAEAPLFPFLPPKYSCSISWHLDGVGLLPTYTQHPGEAPP